MGRDEALVYTKNIGAVVIAVLFVLLPVFFLTNTNDPFLFPKQLLLLLGLTILLLLFGVRSVIEQKLTIKTTPYNIPIFIFGAVVLISSFTSRNFIDSILQSVPLLGVLVLYYMVVNFLEDRMSLLMSIFALLAGGALLSFVMFLQFFKIYLFPFPLTRDPLFNPQGSLLQVLIYLVPLLLLGIYHIFTYVRSQGREFIATPTFVAYTALTSVIGLGILVGIYQVIVAPQKPIILPFSYGFQIALASISQDAARLLQGFLFGSGFGTFTTAFTRFKLPSFNLERDIWNLVFSYSSSFYLELVATTGLLGALSYLFIAFKLIRVKVAKAGGLFLALALLFIVSFVLPFSYSTLFLLFMLLAIYSVELFIERRSSVHKVTVSLVAFKEGLFNLAPEQQNQGRSNSYILPVVLLIAILGLIGYVGYYTVRLVSSDVKFRASFDPANLQNGGRVYDLQARGIADFPWKSDYHRVFSQINFALANSLLANVKPGEQPSADIQRQVFLLLQQSINEGRNAAILSPFTAVNWQNLSQIYRNLINVGQNAEAFAVASLQQAIALDPANPQLYVELGGIYYQLGQYENAQNQFSLAVRLKNDFANAYYNLGHAFEAKGDVANALAQYRVAQSLVQTNPDSLKRISDEVAALEKKVQEGQTADQTTQPTSQTQQPPLEVNEPQVTLPPQRPPVEIPAPPTASDSAQ